MGPGDACMLHRELCNSKRQKVCQADCLVNQYTYWILSVQAVKLIALSLFGARRPWVTAFHSSLSIVRTSLCRPPQWQWPVATITPASASVRCRTALMRTDRPTALCWLQMVLCQLGTRSSATTIHADSTVTIAAHESLKRLIMPILSSYVARYVVMTTTSEAHL